MALNLARMRHSSSSLHFLLSQCLVFSSHQRYGPSTCKEAQVLLRTLTEPVEIMGPLEGEQCEAGISLLVPHIAHSH